LARTLEATSMAQQRRLWRRFEESKVRGFASPLFYGIWQAAGGG
jgi:hypothetical protein